MIKNICISGYYGFDNFGDETILKILIENLKKFKSCPNITVFSANPSKTTALYDNVRSIKTFDIPSVIKELKNCNCLISGGGSLLQDKTSAKSLLYYLFVLFCAKFFRKKIIIFAQGIGPIKNNLLRFLTIFILKRADFVSVRDVNSFDFLKKYNTNSLLCDDPAWNINIDGIQKTDKLGIQLRKFDGINSDFLCSLAQGINKYYSHKNICIFSLQNSLDLEISNEFKNIINKLNPDIKVDVIENTSNDEVIKNIAQMNELIAMRYHACLIAIKSGVKVLPISYDIKVKTLSDSFKLDYIDILNPKDIESKLKDFSLKDIEYDTDKISKLKFDFEKLEQVL